MSSNEFPGGVFSKSLAHGRAGAQLKVEPSGVSAQTAKGESFSISFSEMTLEIGGQKGAMLFCRHNEEDLTFYTEHPQFTNALMRSAPPMTAHELKTLLAAQNKERSTYRSLILGAVGILILALFLIQQALGPLLDKGIKSIPYEVDQKLGELAIENMDLGGKELKNPQLRKAMDTVFERLLNSTDDVKIDYKIVQNSQANAFALPGGKVVVFSGLLTIADTPEQVAGVLAHEIAHVTERHGVERIAKSLGVFATIQLLLGDATGVLAIAKDLLTLATINSYSRDQEAEADEVGVLRLHEAKIDPSQLADFFQSLQEESPEAVKTIEESFNWMSTHPNHSARIEAINNQLSSFSEQEYLPLEINWKEIQALLNHPQEEQEKITEKL